MLLLDLDKLNLDSVKTNQLFFKIPRKITSQVNKRVNEKLHREKVKLNSKNLLNVNLRTPFVPGIDEHNSK